jgi:E3 ubiquitin-protein ligase CHFR
MNGQEDNPFSNPPDTSTNLLVSRQSFTSNLLKRRASPSFEGLEGDTSRKRIKEEQDGGDEERKEEVTNGPPLPQSNFVDELAEELQCGCCSELVYRPVIVTPCQHFFCGR